MSRTAAEAPVERRSACLAERLPLRPSVTAGPRISTLRYLELLEKFSRQSRQKN